MASIYVEESLLKLSSGSDESLLDIFVGQGNPFGLNAQFYGYCAALGKSKKNFKEPKEKSTTGEVKSGTFENNNLCGLIFAIALDEKKDLDILRDTDTCYKIFEGYVNGGLEIIHEKSKNLENEELIVSLMLDVKKQADKNIKFEDDVDPGGELEL